MRVNELEDVYESGQDAVGKVFNRMESTIARLKREITVLREDPKASKTHRRQVYCLSCHHAFISTSKMPTCSVCKSHSIIDASEVSNRFKEDHFSDQVRDLKQSFDAIQMQLAQIDKVEQMIVTHDVRIQDYVDGIGRQFDKLKEDLNTRVDTCERNNKKS